MESASKSIRSGLSQIDSHYHRPAIPICLALIGGICLGNWLPGGETWALGMTLCGVALILRRISLERSAGKVPLGLLFVLGYFSIQPYTAPILPGNHVVNFSGERTYEISGRVASYPQLKNGRQKVKLAVDKLIVDGTGLKVEGYLQLTVYGERPALFYGDSIQFSGRIKEIRNFYNPGGFDYERYMAFQGIRAGTYCQSDQIHFIKRPYKSKGSWGLGLSRIEILRLIEGAAPDQREVQAVLAALLIGRTEMLSPKLRDAFNHCGVGHLLAISGLHMGIVALCGFWVLTRILSFVPILLQRGIARRISVVMVLILVIYYGWLADFSPSTQRAALMVAVLLGTYVFGRRSDIFNTLAWAAVIILILHPPTLFSISFQLSFAAVLAIVVGMRQFGFLEKKYPGLYKKRILRRLTQAVLVSFLALLGTLPLSMYYFNQVSLLGPLANLIFIPLLGFIAVPAGLAAIFVHPLSTQSAIFFFKISAWVVSYSIELIHWMEGISWASLQTFSPNIPEILLYFLLAAVVLEARQLKIFKMAIVLILLLIILDVSFWIHIRYFDSHLRVTTLDVGQGSATLMELPKGKTVLVDGGGFNDNKNFDVGERIVAPFLRRRKIQTLNLVVLTHPNSDHLNGLLYILDNFSVEKIWSNHEQADTLSYRRFEDLIQEKRIDHPEFEAMAKHWQWDQVILEILNPPDDFASRKVYEGWRRSPNNNSIVLKVTFGEQSLFFAGDLMIPAEESLLAAYPPDRLRSTVLMAPHHGSRSSSSPLFIETVHPKIAVFSAGWRNPFDFPHPDVLLRYRNMGAEILRTDHCGAIGMILNGQGPVQVETVLQCHN